MRAPILDANVRRVLTRALGFGADLAEARNERALWSLAEALLPDTDLASTMPRYTQGLMDLGAGICLPRSPCCMLCPLQPVCVAGRAGDAERYPVRTRKLLLHRTELDRLVGAVERRGYTLVPLELYWKDGRAKLLLALAKGKAQHDKRATEKDRDWQRDKARLMRRH